MQSPTVSVAKFLQLSLSDSCSSRSTQTRSPQGILQDCPGVVDFEKILARQRSMLQARHLRQAGLGWQNERAGA